MIICLAIRHEGGVALNSGKKPEKLLKMLLDYTTREGDIILDFFGGSGSTAATAHKMKRQYISCLLYTSRCV